MIPSFNSAAVAAGARPSARAAMVCAAGFAAVWALLEILAGRLEQTYDVIQIEGCRFAAQLLFMLAMWGGRRGIPLWRTQRPVSQLTRGALMLAVPIGFGVAMSHGASPAQALAGLWVAPLFALVLARVWLRDRFPVVLWLAAALGFLGAWVLLAPAPPASLALAVVPILMGLSLALYMALTRSLRHEPVQTNLFYVGLVGFLIVLPFQPWVWVQPSLHDVLLLAGIGIFGLLGLWLLEEALRRWSLPHVAPVLYVHVAGIALLSSATHGRMPTPRVLAGLLLVSVVAVYLWRRALTQDRACASSASSVLVPAPLAPCPVRGAS